MHFKIGDKVLEYLFVHSQRSAVLILLPLNPELPIIDNYNEPYSTIRTQTKQSHILNKRRKTGGVI